MPSDTITVRLDPEVLTRLQEDAKERGVPPATYARILIHDALTADPGEEADKLRREVAKLRDDLATLSDITTRGLRSLFLTLASDSPGHTTEDVQVLFQRLLGKE